MAAYCYSLVISALVLCTTNGQTTTTSRTACTSPPIIANSNHSTTGLSDGSVATYACQPGHQATGSSQYTCRNGVWTSSGPDLVCSVIYCFRPPSVNRGTFRSISGNSYTVGTVVTYNCYSGYIINGTAADITCQANRTWTSPLPSCIKKECGEPPNVDGSNVTFTTTDYYSTAKYVCQRGHDLYTNGFVQRIGRATVRCLSTGRWGTAPTCRPKNCGLPSNIFNGIRFSNGNHEYRDTVTYECNHGYKIHGNSTIECLDTGSWSVLPECKRAQCDSPPMVANATTRLIGKAYFGNSTKYTCSKGFEMTGSPTVSCQADGTWTQKPSCSLVNCRTPPFIHFGQHKWTTTTYNSLAEYSCDDGYKLIGVAKIYCLFNGRWTDTPTCELPPGQTAPSGTRSSQVVAESNSSTLTGLAIACALFGVITLLCLIILIYKLFIAGRTDKLFSYASYKNGDDAINANI